MRGDQRQPITDVATLDRSADLTISAASASRPAAWTSRRLQRWWSPLALYLVADLTALGVAGIAVGSNPAFVGTVLIASVLGIRMANLYRRSLLPTVMTHAGQFTMAIAAGSLAAATVTGAAPTSAVAFTAAATPLLCLTRAMAYAQNRRSAIRSPERAIVVGTGVEGQELVSRLFDHPEYGLVPLGFVDTTPGPIDPSLPVTVLGGLASLLPLVEQLDVQRIFLDSSSVSEPELLEVLDLASGLDIEISVLPALARHLSTSIAVEGVAGVTVLSYRPSRHYGVSWAIKRVIDVLGALVVLVCAAPLALLVAVAIKIDSRGPVLYSQTRVGRHGTPFTIYKFRSMQTNAEAAKRLYLDLNEASGPYFKIKCDPRITRVGRWIRRFSLDELPQALNVLRGDMSLIGPRPALQSEVDQYPDWFRRRLSVRPGLSGLWQVSGRFLVPFSEATRLDVHYVDHWSLGLDLQILARTPAVVLSGRGAR